MNISVNKPRAARTRTASSTKRVFLSRAALLTVTAMIALLVAGVLSTAWATPPATSRTRTLATRTASTTHSTLVSGLATWYGKQFQGRHTASGERFDMHAFTAAHRTLPLGTWLRVTNVINQKSVLVRVNDRGPMSKKYVLDMSYSAAQAIGIAGYANVRIDQLKKDDPEVLLASSPLPVLLPLEPAAVNADGIPQLSADIAAR